MKGLKLLTAILLLGLHTFVLAEESRDPYKFFFAQTLGDYSEELENAKSEGKKGIFIFFEMDECPFCHYMKNNVLNQKSVQEYVLKDFAAFNLDVEGDVMITTFDGQEMAQKEFAGKKHHNVRATPVMMFFDLDGKPVFRYTGKTRGVEEFLWLTDFVRDGHYKDMKFNNYKNQRRKDNRSNG